MTAGNKESSEFGRSPYFLFDGLAYSVMLGLGENYLSPFAIWLHATPLQVGLLASLPLFVGSLFQLLGVPIMERYRDRLPIIIGGATLQAIMWIPIALLPFLIGVGSNTVTLLILLAIVYFGAGNLINPIWTSR